MFIKKQNYEEQIRKYEEQIRKLKKENDEQFFKYNEIIQKYQTQCDFNYNKKLNDLKTKIKKETDFLKIIRLQLEKPVIADPEEYNKWLDCYYKVRDNILKLKI